MATVLWTCGVLVLGLALGLWSGQMFLAMLIYWDGAKVALRSFVTVVSFVLGGGGGAAITRWMASAPNGDELVAWYVIGLATGLIVGRFIRLPLPTAAHSP